MRNRTGDPAAAPSSSDEPAPPRPVTRTEGARQRRGHRLCIPADRRDPLGSSEWRRRGGARAAALALALALAACGDDGEAVTLVEGVEVEVSSIDNTFRPETVEVAAGTEVVWTNDGRNVHNVLPTEGDGWGVEVDEFEPGDEYRHRFTEPGTYPYYCSLHGTKTRGMVGTVVVTG